MSAIKKYFKTKKEAIEVAKERRKIKDTYIISVFKMPKGSRHHGMYAVCTYLEFINTY